MTTVAELRDCPGARRSVGRTCATLLVLALTAAAVARAQGIQVPDDVKENVWNRVNNGWSTGIVIAVLDSTGARYFSYGRTAADGQSVNERTVFEIGSITKIFTALSLADMAIRGEVGLDDPVQRYLPADSVHVPSKDGKEITLRLLSAQRSGLPRMPDNFAPADPNNPYADYGASRMYAFLNRDTLTRDPGASYEYSNLGVGLLGFALARHNGSSYEDMVLQRVIGPLRMRDTRITLTPDLRARLAKGHAGGREVANWDLDALAGAGAIRSTAQDMAKLVAAAAGLVHTPLDSAFRLTEAIEFDAGPGMRIGLGWHVIGPDGSEVIWHNGGTGGYHSFIGFDPLRRIGVVVLSNDASSIDDIGFHLLKPDAPLLKVRVAIAMPAESLQAYVGTYQLAPTFAIAIRRDSTGLVAQATGQGAFPLFASARDEFFFRVVDAQISFTRDSTGKVTSLILHQGGRDLPAPRAP